MAVIIMESVHGTCQRVNTTPLMIDWIFHIGVVKNYRKYVCELVGNDVAIVQLLLWRVLFSYRPGDWSHNVSTRQGWDHSVD